MLGSSLAASSSCGGVSGSGTLSIRNRGGEVNGVENDVEMGGEGQEEEKEVEVESLDDSAASANGAIEALSSLVRNTRIANRSYVCAAIVGVFVRLSCFSEGSTKIAPVGDKVSKSAKKKGKKEEDLPVLTGLNLDIIEAIRLVEGSADGGSSSTNFQVTSEIAVLAGAKLMAILADSGNLSLLQLDAPVRAVKSTEGKEKGDRRKDESDALALDGPHSTLLIDVAVATVQYLSTTGGLKLVRVVEEDDEEVEEEVEEESSGAIGIINNVVASMIELSPTAAPSLTLLTSLTVYPSETEAESLKAKKSKTIAIVAGDTTDSDASNNNNSSSSSSNSEGNSKLRLRDSLYGLLSHSVFHTLTSSVVSLQALQDMATVVIRITAEANKESPIAVKMKNKDDSDDDDDDEDEEESSQSLLFDASMEMLSVSGDHAVKGVRDAIKKVWNSLCQVRSC